MQTDKFSVEKAAKLARLELSGEEKEFFSRQLRTMAEWIAVLKNIRPSEKNDYPPDGSPATGTDKAETFENASAILRNAAGIKKRYIRTKEFPPSKNESERNI